MPRKTTPKKKVLSRKEKFNKSNFGGYIQCRLTKADTELYLEWVEKNSVNVWQVLDSLCSNGMTFSCYFEEYDGSCTAKLSYLHEKNFTTWILSAYHKDLESAVMLLLFKHLIMLDSDWSEEMQDDMEKPLFG